MSPQEKDGPQARLEVAIEGAVDAFRLDVAFQTSHGITALFGPSGAGKSMTLRYLAGLARPTSGFIRLGDRVLFQDAPHGPPIHVHPRRRRVGMVFQDYALFPHLNVGKNVAFGLHRQSSEERRTRVGELLELVGLEGYERRPPRTLSGGERQRVALARALAPEPELLLLDEPFAALDFRVRRGLRDALSEIQTRTGIPMILVTHSLADVRRLSSSLVVLDDGRVVASGATASLLASPPTPEVAALVSADDL
ncbi:MAG: ATP-binding cassette domain-containing protein [Gemmatimonadota bacterium]